MSSLKMAETAVERAEKYQGKRLGRAKCKEHWVTLRSQTELYTCRWRVAAVYNK
jgi:hypothetical protein